MRIMPIAGMVPGQMKINPLLNIDHTTHKEYVDRIVDIERHFRDESSAIWAKSLDWLELFLAVQKDERDPVDEMWRSDIFVPLPYITTRTKAAQGTELLGNTEPVWQVEATREDMKWYDQSKQFERLLDYTHRMNAWRKFLYKMLTSRSIQGTAFMKVIWVKRSHVVSFFPTEAEEAKHTVEVQNVIKNGAPNPPDRFMEPDIYQKWIDTINLSGEYGPVSAPPPNGPTDVIEYEGPVFKQLPLWTVRIDPMIDEIQDQKYIIHRMVKPLSHILSRADSDPNSRKPYYLPNVEAARGGQNGFILEKEEQELAELMGLAPNKESSPYYKDAVELLEVHSPDDPFNYSIIMNRQWVINKRAFESPFLTSHPNIFALRNVVVPGHFYGLSDYQEPEKLFRELNQFRRIRMDGATLTTLPVFVKTSGTVLTEALRKLKPGAVISVPGGANSIQSLIKHVMPAEAYREPAEIKLEIEDATEVYSSTKGAPATIGRVTGTEYQGRAGQVLLKYKVDASIIEEELLMLPPVILSFYAQMGPERMLKAIGGDPGMMVDVTREQIIEAINMRFRFRGATKNIQPDMAVQQIMQLMAASKDVLTPAERRFGLKLVMELLDIRGYSSIITPEGTQMFQQAAQAAQKNQVVTANQATQQTEQAGVAVPPQIDADTMAAITGGGNAG